MKNLRSAFMLALASAVFLAPLVAEAARVRVVRRGPQYTRSVVVVHKAHPIRRAMHPALVVRPGIAVRVAPVRFLPVVAWTAVVVARPAPDRIVWQDSEVLNREDEWSEVVFNSDQRGDKLYLEVVDGRVQFDFAEVVFENGECQVVDFNEKTHRPGFYSLLDFRDGRKIDHVRLIAKSKTEDAKVALLLQK
ncbi:MAG: hypothetical protein U1F61_19365 [Opitutaceae bacterium]